MTQPLDSGAHSLDVRLAAVRWEQLVPLESKHRVLRLVAGRKQVGLPAQPTCGPKYCGADAAGHVDGAFTAG